MVIYYGLRVNILNEMIWVIWLGELELDVWYIFENEIFWSFYDDGYLILKINRICFKIEGKEVCKFEGVNMYYILLYDYKMGFYWNGK